MPERLQKIISAHGVVSRRAAEKMISDGRVSVNGIKAQLGQSADIEIDEIAIDGSPLSTKSELVYIVLNKPRGYLSTASDDRGRKTVMDLVSDVGTRVYPVGRLDMESLGLLLLTNDGDFANMMMHPSYNKQKAYEVKVTGDVEKAAHALRRPMVIDEHQVQAKSASVIKKYAGGGLISISISEGRNRQVRKMCAKCNLNVISLTRVSIGTLELGSLAPGRWRRLTDSELRALYGK